MNNLRFLIIQILSIALIIAGILLIITKEMTNGILCIIMGEVISLEYKIKPISIQMEIKEHIKEQVWNAQNVINI